MKCLTCKNYSLWNEQRPCELNEDYMKDCQRNAHSRYKEGNLPRENPGEILKLFGVKPQYYHIDHEVRKIYIKGLYELGQAMQRNWSPLAKAAMWDGWLLVEAGRKAGVGDE